MIGATMKLQPNEAWYLALVGGFFAGLFGAAIFLIGGSQLVMSAFS
jgi:uncharacterized membrane-anchored protein YitT (DUF2179 family)